MPFRKIATALTSKASLVEDMVAGHGNGLISGGPYPIGDVICFEVAYDSLVRSSVRAGAQLVVVQTNNATFGHSAETYQQLAMAQLRAVEFGRTVVQVSTSGMSAVINPNGRIVARSGALFTADVIVSRGSRWRRPTRRPPGSGRGRSSDSACSRRWPWSWGCSSTAETADRTGRPRAPDRSHPGRASTTTRRWSTRVSAPERVLVVIPTYDEAENVEVILHRLLTANPGVDALVVDDGSPDGTGDLANAIAARDGARARPAPPGQGRAGCGLHRRVPLGARA